MNQNEATAPRLPDSPISIYDRFTGLYDLMFQFNRYGRSIERFLRENPLPLPTGAHILDAGCGTGLLTLALLRVLKRPAQITAVDLSVSSLETARRAVLESGASERHGISFVEANVLELPFPDDSFEFIVTSGALEYVPLGKGMGELARVLAPGGYLLHLPVRPSPLSRLLELMFRFKMHPPEHVTENTNQFFRVIEHHRFNPLEPIGWTKTAMLAQKP